MENHEENQLGTPMSKDSESDGQIKRQETSQSQEPESSSDRGSECNHPVFSDASSNRTDHLSEYSKQEEFVNPVQERRSFVKFLCMLLGSLVCLVPFAAGLRSYLDPLTKHNRGRQGGNDGFVRVTSIDAIPADGKPAKFTVVADKVDAWNRFPNVSIGAVYLRLVNGVPKALHTVCPHLGCFVDYRSGRNDFFCPCHNSNFKLDGSIVEGVSPRPMDALEIEVRNETEVWVKFQNFQPGHTHSVPVS